MFSGGMQVVFYAELNSKNALKWPNMPPDVLQPGCLVELERAQWQGLSKISPSILFTFYQNSIIVLFKVKMTKFQHSPVD